MLRLRSLIIIVVVAAMSAACITFQEQTISYRHDVERDQLLIHSTYVGIYGDGRFGGYEDDAPGVLTVEEQDELASAALGQKLYFFDNWSLVLDMDEVRRQLQKPTGSFGSELDRIADKAKRELWNTLIENVTMSGGPFYLDRANRLCAVQRVTVTNLSGVIRALNALWQPYVRSVAVEDPDWASRAITIEPVLTFTGNQLTIRYPGYAGEDETTPGGVVRAFNVGGIVTLVVGRPDASRVTITKTVETDYLPNAVGFVQQRVGIARDFNPVVDADRFFSSAGR